MECQNNLLILLYTVKISITPLDSTNSRKKYLKPLIHIYYNCFNSVNGPFIIEIYVILFY